jgi:hypothetical protein
MRLARDLAAMLDGMGGPYMLAYLLTMGFTVWLILA